MDYFYNSIEYLKTIAYPPLSEPSKDEKKVNDIIREYQTITSRSQVNEFVIKHNKECAQKCALLLEKLRAFKVKPNVDHAYIDKYYKMFEKKLANLEKQTDQLMAYQKHLNFENCQDKQKTLTQTCQICFTLPLSRALECGHLYCKECPYKFDQCPICRNPNIISKIRTVYF